MGANLSQEQKQEWRSKSAAYVLQYVKEKAPEFATFIERVGITGQQAMLFFDCGGPMAIATLFPTVGHDSAAPQCVSDFTPLSALDQFKAAAESPAVISAISTLLTDGAQQGLANEQTTLSTDRVKQAMADNGITYLKGDWTNEDPEITAMLEKFNRPSVPLYVLYSGDGSVEPVILPQILTPGIVTEAFNNI